MSSLASVLFAARCRLCDQPLTSLSRVPVCESCLGRLQPWEPMAACERCQEPLAALGEKPLCGPCRAGETAFDRLRTFGLYEAHLRDLIAHLKYHGVHPIARPLAACMALVLKRDSELYDVDALVPVPLHRRRKRARGYNQAELLARELGKVCGLPVKTRWLGRRKDTPSQTGLTRAQRVENVRGAFGARNKLDKQSILLIDDVCTTGATLDACARELKRAGATTVQALTAARVVGEI